MRYRLEIRTKEGIEDPEAILLTKRIRNFLGLNLDHVMVRKVYYLDLDVELSKAYEILEAFTNPVIQVGVVGESNPSYRFDWLVMIGYKPGVTDNVARTAIAIISDILGRQLYENEMVATCKEYLFIAPGWDRNTVEHVCWDLLANSLIQQAYILSYDEWRKCSSPIHLPKVQIQTLPKVEVISLDVSDEELIEISKRRTLALSLEEMKTIKRYFEEKAPQRQLEGLPPWPTDVELESIAQTWSEHCKHKIFNALIDYYDEENGQIEHINSLFRTYIRGTTEALRASKPWLLSVFIDNAGVIAFNDSISLVYKVETHNSPSALDPYGGAMTGIVGVNRDPLGTGKGAELLANVWGYCFASPFLSHNEVPPGLFHPRRLRDEVHRGVIDGGNQSGIPYAIGWEYFDHRYLGKPLVYCGTVGFLPKEINGEPGHIKRILPGDFVVMVGGRIGKDGIHGATFSSEELHDESPTQAVQIGDPITQKKLTDFLIEARNLQLYRFITDNGAGGLSSSVGEMSRECGGADIDLANAPLKYTGLQPWEILLSEAQERMTLAVPQEKLDQLLDLARRREVEASVLGRFTDSGKFVVRYKGEIVMSLDLKFLHEGLPQMRLHAHWKRPYYPEPSSVEFPPLEETLPKMLARLNICSGYRKARQYDHEVKGLTIIKPYIGVHGNVPTDAAVLLAPLPENTWEGIVLSMGIAPRYSDIDTYHMVGAAIDIAIRRALAVGARFDYMAGLDNFCWPDPVESPKTPDGRYKLAQLVRANKALYDYCVAFGVPCISGKDSMKNDSVVGGKKISIPPTLLFSIIAKIDDVRLATTLELHNPGDFIYIIGTTAKELGGTEFYAMLGYTGNRVPVLNAKEALLIYKAVDKITKTGLCNSLHAPALGGIGIGFAKMAIAGQLGLEIDLDLIPCSEYIDSPLEVLFSESLARFIAAVSPEKVAEFEAALEGVVFAKVGKVIPEKRISLFWQRRHLVSWDLDQLEKAYISTLDWD